MHPAVFIGSTGQCNTTKRPENPITVLKSTNFRWRFNFADFATWYQPAKVNRRPKFVIEANDGD